MFALSSEYLAYISNTNDGMHVMVEVAVVAIRVKRSLVLP